MANTRQHQPGDNSIDEVNPKKQSDGTWIIRWRWWPWDGGPARQFRHRARTRGDALRKARDKAAELERGAEATGRWSRASRMGDFIEEVSRPAIQDSSALAETTKELYDRSLTILSEHLGHLVIADAVQPDVAITAIETIARTHGAQTGRTARSVANRWVYGRLRRSQIITASPLTDVDIDFGAVNHGVKSNGGVALDGEDYDRILDHLLERDPANEEHPTRSRGTTIIKEQLAIDVTLLQMTTGLRLGSVRQIEPEEIIDNHAGGINIYVPAEKLKGRRRALTVTVLDDRVAERVRDLRDNTPTGHFVFGAPTNRAKEWDRRSATRAIASLYVKLADELGVEALRSEFRSHGWRATLNTLYIDLPPHVRADWFGHSVAVNQTHYSPSVDLSPMVAAAAERQRSNRGEIPSNVPFNE